MLTYVDILMYMYIYMHTFFLTGAERTVKAKRKRKLIVDEVKNISGECLSSSQ